VAQARTADEKRERALLSNQRNRALTARGVRDMLERSAAQSVTLTVARDEALAIAKELRLAAGFAARMLAATLDALGATAEPRGLA